MLQHILFHYENIYPFSIILIFHYQVLTRFSRLLKQLSYDISFKLINLFIITLNVFMKILLLSINIKIVNSINKKMEKKYI